jgi:hypothetical protein
MTRSESESKELSVGWWMLVSTAVVSVRSFFPAIMAASLACCTTRWCICWSALLAKERKSADCCNLELGPHKSAWSADTGGWLAVRDEVGDTTSL